MLAAVAFAASVASLYVHYQLIADPTYVSFCDVSETVSCEAVYKSAYGTCRGVPVAAGGVVWSALVLLLAGYGMRNPRSEAAGRAAGYVFLLSVIGLASVFYFAYASFFVLQKACPLCMAVYVSVVGIFLISSAMAHVARLAPVAASARTSARRRSSPSAMGLGALWLLGSLALVALFPREAIRADRRGRGGAASVPLETLDQAQLDEWHKWIDAQPRVPEVVALTPAGVKVFVVKFNDYQCPACRMTYFAYKDIFAKYEASNPSDFRYETRDFPARRQVRRRAAPCRTPAKRPWPCGWPRPRTPPAASSSRTGCSSARRASRADLIKQGLSEIAQVNSFDAEYPKTIEAIRADVKLGTSVGVNGTPTFFVNGIRWAACGRRISTPRSPTCSQRLKGRGGAAPRRGGGLPSRVYGRHSDRGSHQALLRRVLAPAPVSRARRPDALGRPGRGVRLPGPERRRQDDHAQAADAADLPHVGLGRRSWAGPSAIADVKRRIGYLPENPYFYDHLTAEELLEYFASLFGYGAAERRQRASRLLDEVGIGAERRLQLRKFSKGMLQRVGIAQALSTSPSVVFFDEPMSGLDPLGRREIRAADPAAARQGLHGVLQLARAVGRRGALQPRGDPGRRAPGGRRAAVGDPRVPGPRLGAGGERRAAGARSSARSRTAACRRRCRSATIATRSTCRSTRRRSS